MLPFLKKRGNMQCLRCEIYKNLEEYPTRNNIGYCRKCSARLSEKKYKMSEKGKIVEKRSSKKVGRKNNLERVSLKLIAILPP